VGNSLHGRKPQACGDNKKSPARPAGQAGQGRSAVRRRFAQQVQHIQHIVFDAGHHLGRVLLQADRLAAAGAAGAAGVGDQVPQVKTGRQFLAGVMLGGFHDGEVSQAGGVGAGVDVGGQVGVFGVRLRGVGSQVVEVVV
jgi:hypothetical protein